MPTVYKGIFEETIREMISDGLSANQIADDFVLLIYEHTKLPGTQVRDIVKEVAIKLGAIPVLLPEHKRLNQ